MGRKIRVLIIDDSSFFREAMKIQLSLDAALEIVGSASDTKEGMKMIAELKPDVITLDVEMPGMSGIEFLKKAMPGYAIPVVVVSAVGGNVFDALSAGAVDFVSKPDVHSKMGYDLFVNELKVKIKVASTANRSMLKRFGQLHSPPSIQPDKRIQVIAIGASTGGTEALYEVVKDLPKTTPGIVAVQHMPPGFTRMYAERLNNTCVLEVKEAANGDRVYPGRMLIAPGDFQMKLRKGPDGYFVDCSKGERVSGHCPSVDYLFHSVAEKAGAQAIGIILTGMGADGAKGLLEMRKNGAITLGQNEETCVVYGMPKVAYDMGAVTKQLPLELLADEIRRLTS